MAGGGWTTRCLEGLVVSDTHTRPVEILLVEDSPSDAELTIEAFREAKLRNHLIHVEDGVEALKLLRSQGEYAQAPRPDLILLDWNLPRKAGREVLSEIKRDESLRSIPVVVMTTSRAEQDVLHAYNLQANCYINKPVDFDQFLQVVRSIESFWLYVVSLPTRTPGRQGSTGPHP
jgi:CheY-like chemotaxis protein